MGASNRGRSFMPHSKLRPELHKTIKTRGRNIAMPRTDDRAVRLYIDFPYIEAMLQFRNFLRDEWAYPEIKDDLHLYKMDYVVEDEVPIGNKYVIKYDGNGPDVMKLTTQIIADTYYEGDVNAIEGHK